MASASGAGISPFDSIGVLRTNCSSIVSNDTRGYKALGFQYPSAVVSGDNVIAAYSENKQYIWISIVPKQSVP